MVDEWHQQVTVDYPGNWRELLEWFPDDGACLRFLERLRWREGFVCRFCGAVDGGWWQMADGLRRCSACRSETSVKASTIFAGTRTPLTSWFAAVWYVVNQKQGVSALPAAVSRLRGPAKQLGVMWRVADPLPANADPIDVHGCSPLRDAGIFEFGDQTRDPAVVAASAGSVKPMHPMVQPRPGQPSDPIIVCYQPQSADP
jgi:hypothetical protein